MTFDAACRGMMEALFSPELGMTEEVYLDGATDPVRASVEYPESPAVPPAGGGRVALAQVTVQVTDLPQPRYRLPVVIAGTPWHVVTWAGDGWTWTLHCTGDARVGR
jgi:hypothetical protein